MNDARSYNESYDDRNLASLKPFDYQTTYSDDPDEGESLGIFDVDIGEKDIWQEGEEEKKSYRKTFEKHIINLQIGEGEKKTFFQKSHSEGLLFSVSLDFVSFLFSPFLLSSTN